KLEIYQGTKPGGHFFYHKDSPYLQQCLDQMPVRRDVTVHSFGTKADLHVVGDIQHSAEGLTFQVNGCKSDFFLPLWGDFQVMNALPVIGIARLLGCSEQQIAQGFRSLKLTGMRANRIQVGPAWILDDTYKSNPESAKAAIDALMSMPAATHIAVLADMLDLGENEWALHEQIGQYAKQKGVDQMICTGPRSKATVQGFGQSALWMETQEEIVQVLKETVQKPCAVLIKGSRALAMDRIVEELRGAQR
ncbi:MAG: UDP-N-acetylmuramoyl-tripeptide--D-alanyl-D-alanine ligase, partial [Erysipelotrichaceae bacterium]|nr:UDP-N-acetylmuramoyl-tripeptide--D-alanyl-D-alanine ligase [Erysipelotrichaceae bacterium]